MEEHAPSHRRVKELGEYTSLVGIDHDQLDLMVAVHDSNKVLSGASQAGDDSSSTLVQQAHNRQNEHRRLIVGFAPVGINHEPAAEVIRSWLDTGLEPLSRTFVEGAQAPDGFIKVVLRWILLLVGRDPTKPPPAPLPTNDRSQLLPTSVDEYFGDLR